MQFPTALLKTSVSFLLCLVAAAPVVGGGGPENLVLVVNANSASSLAVANHYIHLRDIPRHNVIYLDSVPDREQIRVDAFVRTILQPVLTEMDQRKLGSHVDYIVYSADFPTVIDIKIHRDKLVELKPGLPGRLYMPWASINALTYFYPSCIAGDPSYMLLDANWYSRRVSPQLLEMPFLGDRQKSYAQALVAYKQDRFEDAADRFRELAKKHPGQVAAGYQLARCLAQLESKQEAMRQLQRVVAAGWCYRSYTANDEAFADLQEEPEFQTLLSTMPDKLLGMPPTRGFTSRVAWGPNRWPNSEANQGKRLMLSTVLAVTRNRGTTLSEALDQISKSVSADGTRPAGKFYFTSTGDVRSKTRRAQIPIAIAALRELGLASEQIGRIAPVDQKQILGVTMGVAKFNWENVRSQLIPGAIADNLTSTGGVMRANGAQTPLTEFLKHGAAGASGTVCEPLAIAAKFPNAMIHAHYARGCSLAEAFYQSVDGPFQLLIVGDPLCQPWARFPDFEVRGLADGDIIDGAIAMEIEPATNGVEIARYEMYLDGVRGRDVAGSNSKINISTNQMSDGYHEIRIVAVEPSLIGTRKSRRIGFEVRRGERRVELKPAAGRQTSLDGQITLNATATFGEAITIMQNSRAVGKIDGDEGSITIEGKLLGLGKTTLIAVVSGDDLSVSSRPMSIEVTP